MWNRTAIPTLMIVILTGSLAGCGSSGEDGSASSLARPGSELAGKAEGDADGSGKTRVNLITPNIVGEGGSAAITVLRYGNKDAALTVYYAVGGTATPGVDYVALSGRIAIPAGAEKADITLTTLDNGVIENGDKVTFSIIPNGAYESLVEGASTVLIVDKLAKGEF